MKLSIKESNRQRMVYETLLEKHDLLFADVDALFSALYVEFGINDTDIILEPGEVVDYLPGTEQWIDSENNREILNRYYEYAAEFASANR